MPWLGLWKSDSFGARWRQALHYLWVQGEQVVTHGLPEAVLGNLVVRLQLEVRAQWGAAYRGSGTYNSQCLYDFTLEVLIIMHFMMLFIFSKYVVMCHLLPVLRRTARGAGEAGM